MFSFRGKGFSLAGQDNVLEIICAHKDIFGRFYQFLYLSLQGQIQDFLSGGGGGCITTHTVSHYYIVLIIICCVCLFSSSLLHRGTSDLTFKYNLERSNFSDLICCPIHVYYHVV